MISRLTLGLVVVVCLVTQSAPAQEPNDIPPKPYYWDGDHLLAIRNGEVKSPAVQDALKTLEEMAEFSKTRGPYSVVDKKLVPPSGDKHDYLSYSRYWWPNPKTDDGLPYIRKDGIVNRAIVAKGDRVRLANFCDDVEATALASYLLRDDEAGRHANQLLTRWFISPETRMTPSAEYAQGVPGLADGRPVGILDLRNFLRLFDAIALLKTGGYLTQDEIASLQDWFREYSHWLATSPMAQGERAATNNHGTWFYAQEAAVAMFIGDKEKASKLVRHARDVRIAAMIEPDGRQPRELERTLSMHYSYFQLEAFMHLARLGEQLDIDLFYYEAPNGACLERAFEFLIPYLVDDYKAWPYKQIQRLKPSDKLYAVLLLAAEHWDDDRYLKAIKKAPRREDQIYFAPLYFRE